MCSSDKEFRKSEVNRRDKTKYKNYFYNGFYCSVAPYSL